MRTRIVSIVWLLVAITAASLGLSALVGRYAHEQTEELSVVASFYPLYTAALQVVGEADGVSVSCLAAPTTGCLHDYQLSPSERAQLGTADVLVINGGGMESFLEAVLPSLPDLMCVDTTADVELLCGEDHGHAHDHDHESAHNPHAWVDPARYAQQVTALCEGLCKADPAHAVLYRQNTADYVKKIQAIEAKFNTLPMPFDTTVVFHESMEYVAQGIGLPVAGSLPIGEQQAASASELAELAAAISGKRVLFLYDDQYPMQYASLMDYADTAVSLMWNTASIPTKGIADRDAWLVAMEENVRKLQEVIG